MSERPFQIPESEVERNPESEVEKNGRAIESKEAPEFIRLMKEQIEGLEMALQDPELSDVDEAGYEEQIEDFREVLEEMQNGRID